MKNDVEIKWQEVPLSDVMRFYFDAFKFPKGTGPVRYDWFLDTHQRIVVFKVIIAKDDKTREP